MIIGNIIGGLGNQMFQYAAGRALAQVKSQEFLIDASDFDHYSLHRFELMRVFDCAAELASERHLRKILGWRSYPFVRNMLKRAQFSWLRGRHYVVEPHFHYWPEISNVPDDCYLVGYWQSEKYFSDAEECIRNDFVFRTPLAGRNVDLATQITGCNAVSLHIRRGDYITDARTNSTHGTCSLDYYRDAVAYIVSHVASPCFFVFSDDIGWVRENLSLDFPCIFIDHNRDENNYCDMQLMSMCNHHIIANSSFSWWGAWLNSREDKLVIAPKQWFVAGYSTHDLIPPTWVRL